MPSKEDGFQVTQVGIVVSDLDDAICAYTRTFGWGPWREFDSTPPRLEEFVNGGAGWRVALAAVGAIDIELIQPLDERSQQGQFLKDHGPGLNHLLIRRYSDGEEITVEPSLFDAPLIGGGSFGSAIDFQYIDARPTFGSIFELTQGSTAELFRPDRIHY